jgi:hypothetical protein
LSFLTSWILALAPLGAGCRTGYGPDLFPSLFMIISYNSITLLAF